MTTTDDESLLRAIIAAPRDEAPRLIYADWLEERGHVDQSAFVRGELDVFRRPRDSHQFDDGVQWLGEIAIPLDPEWVARVSRPPVGVCCDHMQFHEYQPGSNRPELTPRALDAIEGRFGITLPADYRAFLLNYNGGRPGPSMFPVPGGGWFWVEHFHSVWSADGTARYGDYDLVARLQLLDEDMTKDGLSPDPRTRDLIDIARSDLADREWLFLRTVGAAAGQVHLVDLCPETAEPFRKVADSFSEFLALFGTEGET